MTADAFRLAFICTGNRFRSPLAAAVAAEAAAGLPVEIESAGLLELGGAGALEEAIAAGAAVGLDLSAHRCRRLPAGSLRRTDLVIGFERMHLNAAVSEGGANVARVFTLPEAVELLERQGAPAQTDDRVSAARERVRRAQALRGELRGAPPEIPDPLGRADALQRQIAETVTELTGRLISGLFGPTGRLTRP